MEGSGRARCSKLLYWGCCRGPASAGRGPKLVLAAATASSMVRGDFQGHGCVVSWHLTWLKLRCPLLFTAVLCTTADLTRATGKRDCVGQSKKLTLNFVLDFCEKSLGWPDVVLLLIQSYDKSDHRWLATSHAYWSPKKSCSYGVKTSQIDSNKQDYVVTCGNLCSAHTCSLWRKGGKISKTLRVGLISNHGGCCQAKGLHVKSQYENCSQNPVACNAGVSTARWRGQLGQGGSSVRAYVVHARPLPARGRSTP
jgi:hypothetical protein